MRIKTAAEDIYAASVKAADLENHLDETQSAIDSIAGDLSDAVDMLNTIIKNCDDEDIADAIIGVANMIEGLV